MTLLFFLFSGLHLLNAQDLAFSISVKGNHSFAEAKSNNNFQNSDISSFFINPNTAMSIEGKAGFEIGAQARLKLDEKIKIISGLAFQQIGFEIAEQNTFDRTVFTENGQIITLPPDIIIFDPFNPDLTFEQRRFKDDVQISYIKIPFLAEIDIIKEKVFFQLGFYGASLINVKSSNQFSSPRSIDDLLSSIVIVPDPKDQFTSLIMGFQSGLRVKLIKQLNMQIDYSRSMSNIFDENNLIEANMNNISAGLSWNFDL